MKYKTLARLLVRGAGLLLIVQTIPACANATYSFVADFFARTAPTATVVWWFNWQVSYLLDSGLRFGIGLFLFLRPNWVTNLLIPSNRPYCHECGYDLSGSPPSGDCAECGTPYTMKQRRGADNVPAPPAE